LEMKKAVFVDEVPISCHPMSTAASTTTRST
jgi:hypothetical protein